MADPIPIFTSESRINKLQVECDSLISYVRQRAAGKRRYHNLILKRIKGIRESLNILEEEIAVRESEASR